ncbi:deoxyguanosinetriphosphate triphosphohydrolase [Candidatus Peregrinibacteria bacterium]|nr:deoxyguanosinetriphosphate triphosphohydrolase [Candidatus Peregrinibacteria bacterium]
MSTILQKKELDNLASYAIKSKDSVGRRHAEKLDDERLCFQRDKDRIIHSKAFRRLDEKTQVFVAGSGDHYRTRLTHTLEVAQVARDIARRLRLNEDLCEAIALAHDLGHPPFGHAGEEALNDMMEDFDLRFEHNEQSRRVVEFLEKAYPRFPGINLTIEVLDGLMKHQTAWDQAGKIFEISAHLEAQAVNVADEIAYTNHDMDDGIRSGLISLKQLRKFKLWQLGEDEVREKYGKKLPEDILVARVISSIIALMIDDFCKQTEKNIKKFKIKSPGDVRKHRGTLGKFSENMEIMIKELRQFLFENFYLNPKIEAFTLRGKWMIKKLFEYYYKHQGKFPKSEKMSRKERLIAIKDYIAGMTDRFLIQEFKKI